MYGVHIFVNAAVVKWHWIQNGSGTGDRGVTVSTLLDLNATDFVEIFTYQNSGGNETAHAGTTYTSVSLHKVA
ncbi:unnamed protein product [marine sediment metagenome]|uniref:Uncharacterized protein n=1 Tax=marine sediment metagenome TaxID=412755 RepID=X1EDK9_9ZZZZ